MEFDAVLANRFSARKYKPGRKLKNEQINKIIDAGRIAPSAKNRQPWIFKVLNDSEKDIIAKMMIEYKDKNKEKHDAKFGENSCNATGKAVLDASVMILVLRKDDKDWITGDTLSIGAAIEHMLLEATNMGLGSLWIRDTVYVEDKILKLIDEPELKLVSSLIIGYADERQHIRNLKSLKDTII